MRAVEPNISIGLASLIPSVERADMTTILRGRPDGQIDVELIQGEIEFGDDSTDTLAKLLSEMQELMGGTHLRGRVTPSGEITSFWLPQEQKNLLSMFFELPSDSIAVGDTWRLNGTSLLFVSGPFIVDKASLTNEVQLVALEGDPMHLIAVLNYNLRERIAGDFGHLEFAFSGRGEFDVAAGTWRRFGGHMSIENTFMGAQSSVQEFALEPVSVPEDER